MDVVRDGIPSTWTELAHDSGSKIYRDSEKDPRYVAKIRAASESPSSFRREMQDLPEFGREIIADNSILNEILLSPRIKKILESEAAQQIARGCGFESIGLVEPLIGVISRTSGEKIVFYEWQKGYSNHLDTDPLNPLPRLTSTDFIPNLTSLFLANRIEPHDLALRQLIADRDSVGKPRLHLIDTQQYVKVQAP